MRRFTIKGLSLFTSKALIKLLSHFSIIVLLILCSLWILRAPLVQWAARQPLPNDWAVELTGLTSPSITQWRFKELTVKRRGEIVCSLREGLLQWNPALLWQKKIIHQTPAFRIRNYLSTQNG